MIVMQMQRQLILYYSQWDMPEMARESGIANSVLSTLVKNR